MKKIPNKFYLKGHAWKVRYRKVVKDEQGDACYGLCIAEKRLIIIEKGMLKDVTYRTFLHELAHAVLHELHLVNPADGGMNSTQEGVFCEGFADIMSSDWAIESKKRRRRKTT